MKYMNRKIMICTINEEYLNNVKKQMIKQKIPLPKDDGQITIAHKLITTIEVKKLNCDCKVCKKITPLLG
ncbi:MAG: hypothetical protein QXM85_01430 [Candidatus Aenigmatarchaeota archaeon]